MGLPQFQSGPKWPANLSSQPGSLVQPNTVPSGVRRGQWAPADMSDSQ
jgi:hypothetical protein